MLAIGGNTVYPIGENPSFQPMENLAPHRGRAYGCWAGFLLHSTAN
jgi:hypothetical protein